MSEGIRNYGAKGSRFNLQKLFFFSTVNGGKFTGNENQKALDNNQLRASFGNHSYCTICTLAYDR